MKKILIYIAAALYCLAGIQAAENVENQATGNPSLIRCRIINTTWTQRKQLYGKITYKDKRKKEFFLILKGITEQMPKPQKNINLPSGGVSEVSLFVYNYRKKTHRNDVDGTLIASLTFKPFPSSLAEVTFTIQDSTIISQAVYNLPPKFNDKHPNSITKRHKFTSLLNF